MTRRHSVARWLALGLILALVGLVSQGTTSAQTPLAETRQSADDGDLDRVPSRNPIGVGMASDRVGSAPQSRGS